ncbi:MAG: hypothetical protein IID51_03765 [Proteobacteria bacterium]|nr:hypothetical protein [Pseudomonadota bacterium]
MTVSIVAAAMILVIAGSVAANPASAARLEFVRAAETLVVAGNEALAEDEAYGALTLFEQAIVANPKNADAYVGLGRVHVKLGKTQSGLNYFSVALEIEPTHLSALEAEAITFLSIGEIEDAEETLSRISRICGERFCPEQNSVTAAISSFQEKKIADSTE